MPCRTGKSNLRRQRAGPMLYQLSYIPALFCCEGQKQVQKRSVVYTFFFKPNHSLRWNRDRSDGYDTSCWCHYARILCGVCIAVTRPPPDCGSTHIAFTRPPPDCRSNHSFHSTSVRLQVYSHSCHPTSARLQVYSHSFHSTSARLQVYSHSCHSTSARLQI